MKLHEALRNIVREFGFGVLEDKRFLGMLADTHAYEEYPAMKQVMTAIADGGYGQEILSRVRKSRSRDLALYFEYLRRSLSETENFKKEFADYAARSISFALGLSDSATEPQDHGFEAAASDVEESSQAWA